MEEQYLLSMTTLNTKQNICVDKFFIAYGIKLKLCK